MAKKVRPVLLKHEMSEVHNRTLDWWGESKQIPSGPGILKFYIKAEYMTALLSFCEIISYFSCKTSPVHTWTSFGILLAKLKSRNQVIYSLRLI